MKAKILSFGNAKTPETNLNEAVFGLPLRRDILQRVVEWQRAKKQAGTHKTKEIGDIAGSTAKPFKQKGTGNARQGSRYSTQQRGGATVFGPIPRSHAHSLPRRVRQLGLKTALSAKQAEGKLQVIADAALTAPKTRELAKELAKTGLSNVLFISGKEVNENFAKATRNIKHVDVLPQQGANVYDILNHENLILTVDAVKLLEERLA